MVKNTLGLQWKHVRSLDEYVNTQKNIDLRRDFANQVVELMQEKRIILNFDETTINASNWRSMSWINALGPRARKYQRKFTGLLLLLAVTSIGDLYFKFLKGSNNEWTVSQFFIDMEMTLTL